MKTIKLTKGMVTQVDDDDYEKYGHLKWRLLNGRYAYRQDPPWDKPTPVLLHRVVVGALPGQHVHHVDGDMLNNQKANLEKLSPTDHHSFHQRTNGPLKGDYKGVIWDKRKKKWCAQIGTTNGHIFGGYHDAAYDAARAYDTAALKLWGPGIYLNFPCLQWAKPFVKRARRCKGYRGVSWGRDRWVVFFQRNGAKQYLGRYRSELEAAMTYDRAAVKAMGNRSVEVLNFPCLLWMYRKE